MTATINLPARTARAIRNVLAKSGVAPYLDDTHPKQRAFVMDCRPRIACQGGRRGGKTDGIGRRFIRAAHRFPGELSVYVTLTRGRAKAILWDQCLRKMSERYGLGLKKIHDEGLLYIEFPNKHRIWLVGVDNQSEVDKLRGNKFAEAVVDEAMAMPEYLKELIEDSIEPSLMELGGSCVIAGSPSPVMIGYFYDATTGANPDIEAWPNHHFNVLDNIFIPHAAKYLAEKVRTSYGKNPKHPTYVREWLGQWVEDVGALIYPFTHETNGWTPQGDANYGLPPGDYAFGLGVDLGYGDNSTAFVLAAKLIGSGEVYILSAYTRSKFTPLQVSGHVADVREKVKKETGCSLAVVVDEGGLGGGYADQMRDLGVGCEAAQKSGKRAFQDYAQGLILAGSVKVHFGNCAPLIAESRKLQFDPETGKEDERYVNHACDGFLYITRRLFPRYDPKETEPEPGSPEAVRAEMAKLKADAIKQSQKRRVVKYG